MSNVCRTDKTEFFPSDFVYWFARAFSTGRGGSNNMDPWLRCAHPTPFARCARSCRSLFLRYQHRQQHHLKWRQSWRPSSKVRQGYRTTGAMPDRRFPHFAFPFCRTQERGGSAEINADDCVRAQVICGMKPSLGGSSWREGYMHGAAGHIGRLTRSDVFSVRYVHC